MTCIAVLSKHMWKYLILSIQTSTWDQKSNTFPLHRSDFQDASSKSGEAHCKIHRAYQSARSPLVSSCLSSILASPCVSSQSESLDGPLKNSQSTDTASEIIDNPDLLPKLWIFKLCSGNYGYSSSKSEQNFPCSTSEIIHLISSNSKGFSKTASMRPTGRIFTPGIFSGQLIAC